MSELSLLKLTPSVEGSHDRRVIIAPGDPGGVAFLEPSLEHMMHDHGLDVLIMANRLGEEKLQKNPTLQLEPVPESVLDTYDPHVIVSGVEIDDRHQVELRDRFLNARTVLNDDNYGAANYLLDRGFRPDRIITFNQVAKDAILSRFGDRIKDLAERIEITGHPALDDSLNYSVMKRRREIIRNTLGLSEEDNLLVCFATIGETELIEQFAAELAINPIANLKVVFNRHPRDPIPSLEYWQIFEDAGVPFYRTGDDISYPQLLGAADAAAILPQSTAASHAVLRVPTLHVQAEYAEPTLYQTPVVYDASPLVTPADFMPVLEKLLDPSSPRKRTLYENARKLYPFDGASAKRVASAIGKMASRSSLVKIA